MGAQPESILFVSKQVVNSAATQTDFLDLCNFKAMHKTGSTPLKNLQESSQELYAVFAHEASKVQVDSSKRTLCSGLLPTLRHLLCRHEQALTCQG